MSVLTKDFEDFLNLLQKYGVKFVVCGGHAVGFYGYPRLTMGFDLLFQPDTDNAKKIIRVLNEFGFGSSGITESAFLEEGTAVTLGVQPNQIDLLTSVTNLLTCDIFKNAVKRKLEDFDVLYISKDDLIKCKKAVGRLKDLADIEELEKVNTWQRIN